MIYTYTYIYIICIYNIYGLDILLLFPLGIYKIYGLDILLCFPLGMFPESKHLFFVNSGKKSHRLSH